MQPDSFSSTFVTMRNLYLSLIPKEIRDEKFPLYDNIFPSNLVTASMFMNEFWNHEVPEKTKRIITSSRAWFGIRSILQGGKLGKDRDVFNREDFCQLTKEEEGVPRKHTQSFYSDEELEVLINLQSKYHRWKKNSSYYDELDIVKEALKHYEGVEKKDVAVPKIDKKTIEEIINRGILTNIATQDVIVSYRAQKELRKSKKLHTPFTNWVKNRRAKKETATSIGTLPSGIEIFKSKASKSVRVFFIVVRDEQIHGGKSFIIVLDICHTNDQDRINQYVDKNHEEIERQITDIKGAHFSNFEDIGVDGPVKPTPIMVKPEDVEKLLSPDNIFLDKNQQRAVIGQLPLLLDGLAGTGKTTIVGKRAALRLSSAKKSSHILVCASMSHVVKRLFEATDAGISDATNFIALRNCEIDVTKGTSVSLEELQNTFPPEGFHEILIDECQDLTLLEFELINRMTYGQNPERLVLAGDPLQALNPTGFDWGQIQAMFVDKGLDPKDCTPQKFHNNYRSQRHVVNLANGIQRHRKKLVPKSYTVEMKSQKEPTFRPTFVYVPEEDNEALKKLLLESGRGKNNAVVICWASDDHELRKMLEDSSTLLNEVWESLDLADYKEADGFRTKLLIHSSTSIKGDERDAVVLFDFMKDQKTRNELKSLNENIDKLTKLSSKNKIATMYAFSRLYVAITRAFDNVFIIETTKQGYEFWQNLKLVDRQGEVTDFITPSTDLTRMEATFPDTFNSTEEKTKSNFYHYRKKWEDQNDLEALKIAMNIGNALVEDGNIEAQLLKHLDKLLGQYNWYHYHNSRVEKERKHFLSKAEHYFSKSGDTSMLAPIKFENEEWNECINYMRGNDQFAKLVKLYCRAKLQQGYEDAFDYEPGHLPKQSPPEWNNTPQSLYDGLKEMIYDILSDDDEEIKHRKNWFEIDWLIKKLKKDKVPKYLFVELYEQKNNSTFPDTDVDFFIESIKTKENNLPLAEYINVLENQKNHYKVTQKIVKEIANELIKAREKYLKTKSDKLQAKNNKIFSEHIIKGTNHIRNQLENSPSHQDYEVLYSIYTAMSLASEYNENSTPGEYFFGKEKLKSIINIALEIKPYYEQLEYSYLNHVEGLRNLLIDIADIGIHADCKDRFSWLNDDSLFDNLVKEVQKLHLSSQSEIQEDDRKGFHATSYALLYWQIRRNEKRNAGRKNPLYIEILNSVIFNEDLHSEYNHLWNPMKRFLMKQVKLVENPISDKEFEFLVYGLRFNDYDNDITHFTLEESERDALGFTEMQINKYELEIFKSRNVWTYKIDDNVKLEKSPSNESLKEYKLLSKNCGEKDNIERCNRLIPKDWNAEFEKFRTIDTYQEFWEHLLELHENCDHYENYVNTLEMSFWIEIINSLTPGAYPLPIENLQKREDAIKPIQKLSDRLYSFVKGDDFIHNPYFFIQFTHDLDWFIANRNQIDNSTNLPKDLEMECIYSFFDNKFEEITNKIRGDAPKRPTIQESRDLNYKITEINSINLQIKSTTIIFDLCGERIAIGLRGMKLAKLKAKCEIHGLNEAIGKSKKETIEKMIHELKLTKTHCKKLI